MKQQILELEKLSSQLEPDSDTRKHQRESVIKYSERFLENLAGAKAFEPPVQGNGKLLSEQFFEEGIDVHKVMQSVEKSVDRGGINPASGNHFGYIPGGGIYSAALGDYLAAVSNRYAGVWFASPGAVNVEKSLCNWMADLIGFTGNSGGYLSSGGSLANLTAVVAARESKGISTQESSKTVIYLTKQAHHCIDKALAIAGLGKSVIRRVEMDNRFRMDPAHLNSLIEKDIQNKLKPWLVVGSAGTTDTGAIDPLNSIADVARKYNLWYHVDAAYGGFFLLDDQVKGKMKGIEKADSVVLDPHKALFLPYGIGALIVRDISTLKSTFRFDADYMQDADSEPVEYSPADISPELSKHFRGLRMWLPLKVHGVAPFRAAIQEKLLLARYAHEKISSMSGFETGPEPDLSVVTFRYIPGNGDPDEFNRRLHQELLSDGRIFLSTTLIDGKFVLRLAIVSVRSHLSEVNRALTIIQEKASQIDN
ncbi:MAG TPA: aminotransferase class V-fold PLP-dependent enzyme [Balneolaceae bacterium]|nr:aminotransferase class V-fold PLP-dependent enzyme [Balneolaceae bacterium]